MRVIKTSGAMPVGYCTLRAAAMEALDIISSVIGQPATA
jgi:hypothetical protein